jgi:hypothetical protein
METSGFWQRTLDGAVMLFILAVITLKIAVIVKVVCIDWGQIFTVGGLFAFIAVLLAAVRNAFAPEAEMPTLLDHSAAAPKSGKGGGK